MFSVTLPGMSEHSAADTHRGRISERLKAAAKKVVNPRRARSLLGTRLILAGLTGLCLASGIDYFKNAQEIRHAATGMALDAGHPEIVSAVDEVDRNIEGVKKEALSWLPAPIRRHLGVAAFAGGVLALLAGSWIKLGAHEGRGRSLRDVGRLVAAPGFVGVLAFTLLALRSPKLRSPLLSFWRRDRGFRDVWDLTAHYAPWAWNEIGALLVIGGALAAVFVALKVGVARAKKPQLKLEFLARFTFWSAVLVLSYYALATAATVASYGSALSPYLAWPWKLTPGAFLSTVSFMACGIALARTGSALMRREAARASEAASA